MLWHSGSGSVSQSQLREPGVAGPDSTPNLSQHDSKELSKYCYAQHPGNREFAQSICFVLFLSKQ